MNEARLLGVVCGMLVGIILVVIIMKFVNRDGASKTKYDERQQIIRGRGFQYGFIGMAAMTALMIACSAGDVELPVIDGVVYFAILAVGLVTAISYFIWNEAYWGVNTSQPRFYVVMVMAIILNIVPIVYAASEGELIVDGIVGITGINLMCGILCLIVLCEAVVKEIVDRKAGEE